MVSGEKLLNNIMILYMYTARAGKDNPVTVTDLSTLPHKLLISGFWDPYPICGLDFKNKPILPFFKLKSEKKEKKKQTNIFFFFFFFFLHVYSFYILPHNSDGVLWFHVGRP